MKNKIIAIALCLLVTAGHAQNGAELLHQRLTAFAESGEYSVHRVDSTNPYVRAYAFGKVFCMEGIGDERFLFNSFRLLDRAFFTEATQAQEVYLHNAQEGDSPLPGIQVNIGEKPIMGRAVNFQPGTNVRLLSFNKPDGMRHCFLLMWSQYLKKGVDFGSEKGQVWYMSGSVYEFEGKKPRNVAYLSAYQPKAPSRAEDEGSEATRATSFKELQAKVKRLCLIYERETEQGRTSAVIVLNKLCNSYEQQLTEGQYNELIGLINPLFTSAKDESHQQMLGLSCATLYRKSEHYKQGDDEQEQKDRNLASRFGQTHVTMTNLSKLVTYSSMMLSDAEQVECVITGRTEADATSVTLKRWPQMENMGDYPVDAGCFNIKCRLPKNEIIGIYSKDGNVQFVVDGNPVTADLTKRVVTSLDSPESQRIDAFLNSMSSVERELRTARNDSTRQASVMAFLRKHLKNGLKNNPDNLISAFSLFKSYSEMTAEELAPYMSDDYTFCHHPLLAPVHEYYEGLLKRRPGTPAFTDAELKDPLNVVHKLSEYVGKGYVLLHFWNSRQPKESALPQLKSIYDNYQPKGLRVISIALNSDNYPPAWREEIKKQQLQWTQLWADKDVESAISRAYGIHALPEVLLIAPDGTIAASPQTIEVLEQVLQEHY